MNDFQLLSYKTSVADKIYKLTNRFTESQVWEAVDKAEKRDLDFMYAMIKNKETELLEVEVTKRIKPTI
jgi:hypothetical protein